MEISKYENKKNNIKAINARKIGKRHILDKKPCQDYCLLEDISKDVTIVALADGHGNSKYIFSDVGSKIACEVIRDLSINFFAIKTVAKNLEYFKTKDFKDILISTFNTKVLEHYEKNKPEDEKDKKLTNRQKIIKYGTTLLFAIVTKNEYILGQIGDGIIAMLNKADQAQIFKRHNIKYNSVTSSMVDEDAQNKLIIDIYPRSSFSYIVLSTDGIYDKLDIGNSFYLYSKQLKRKFETNLKNEKYFLSDTKHGFADEVFKVEKGKVNDIYESTNDDCTVGLIISMQDSTKYDLSIFLDLGYSNLSFLRYYNFQEKYVVQKDEFGDSAKYLVCLNEKQITKKQDKKQLQLLEEYLENNNIKLEKAIDTVYDGQKEYKIYNFKKGMSLKEIYEKNLLSDKKHSDFSCDEKYLRKLEDMDILSLEDIKYSNENLLKIYNFLNKIISFLETNSLDIYPFFLENVFPDENGILHILDNCFYTTKKKSNVIKDEIKPFMQSFGIFGKIKNENLELPLFKTRNNGQIIYYNKEKDEKLFQVVYNEKIDSFGLWNLSDKKVILNGEQIIKSKILKLGKKQKFNFKYEDIDFEVETY